jgi:hypothetical protein
VFVRHILGAGQLVALILIYIPKTEKSTGKKMIIFLRLF